MEGNRWNDDDQTLYPETPDLVILGQKCYNGLRFVLSDLRD